MKIEEESKGGYYNVDNDVDVQAHKAFIAQEERDAAAYYGTHTKPGKVWVTNTRQHDGNMLPYTGNKEIVEANWLWQ